MLEKLVIKNYLLLKDIEIDFSGEFNVITGETGAGKTILINALSLLLGERADYSIISKNKDKMIIEGLITRNRKDKVLIEKFLKERNIDDIGSDNIIIRRELYSKGYSRNFINDTPVNINDLEELGDMIIDIHSQNEHQSLLKKDLHLKVLDSYISSEKDRKFEDLMNEYRVGFEKLTERGSELEKMSSRKNELENKRSFLEFQLMEIRETDPHPGEDRELEEELKVSENAEQIRQSLSAVYSHLYEDSGSVAERIKTTEKELEKIQEFSKEIPQILGELNGISPVVNELSRQIHEQLNNISFDPERIEKARERLYKLQFLKKKYGGSLDSVVELKEHLEADLSLLENFDDKLGSMEKEFYELRDSLHKKAQVISKARRERAKSLEESVAEVLQELGLENAGFKVNFKNTAGGEQDNLSTKNKSGYVKLTGNGTDDIEFLVKINKGEEFLSLRKTASGGEVSRIMLAIKTVLAESDKTGVLVFDEIDTGISGRIAQKAGILLRKLSKSHQVITITHLAQIAALAGEHFLVEKQADGEQTVTRIRKLNDNEKVIEVAKLLSGEKVTDSAIKGAKELMTEKLKIKN